MSETKTAPMPAPAIAPAKEEPTITTGTIVGRRACNVVVGGTALRDENGSLVVDPNRTEIILSNGERHRVRTANITGSFRFGATVHLLWATVEGYNEGKPFVDVVMID